MYLSGAEVSRLPCGRRDTEKRTMPAWEAGGGVYARYIGAGIGVRRQAASTFCRWYYRLYRAYNVASGVCAAIVSNTQ